MDKECIFWKLMDEQIAQIKKERPDLFEDGTIEEVEIIEPEWSVKIK